MGCGRGSCFRCSRNRRLRQGVPFAWIRQHGFRLLLTENAAGRPEPASAVAVDEHQQRRVRRRTAASPGGCRSQPGPGPRRRREGRLRPALHREATASVAPRLLDQSHRRGARQAAISARLDGRSSWSNGQRARRRLLLPHTRAGATLGAGALLVVRESGHAAGVIASGVMQAPECAPADYCFDLPTVPGRRAQWRPRSRRRVLMLELCFATAGTGVACCCLRTEQST
jgi:hypothetical protein